MPPRRPSKARKIGDFPPFRQPPARCDGVKTPMKTAPRFPTGYPVSARSFSLTLKSRIMTPSQPWTPGTGGAQPPCQRERSDRALDRVTAVETFHRGDVPDSHRPPPFGLLAEAVPQQPRAGNRPVSGARPAPGTYSRETLGYVVETDCARPPPTGTTVSQVKPSTVPWVLHVPAFTAFLRFPGSSHRHVSRCARA